MQNVLYVGTFRNTKHKTLLYSSIHCLNRDSDCNTREDRDE